VTATTDTRLTARRAIEALRSGVPCRDAVAALGTGQGEIEDRFTELLDSAGSYRPEHGRGLLLGGGFGAGKSHVLEHLAHLALDRGFAVSRVVISKETPLHDPAKVLRTAVETAAVDDATVSAVGEAAAGLDPGSTSFADLLRWSSGPGAPVDERFPLTLSLLARMQASDDEFVDTIVRFWSGDAISVAALRREAKRLGLGKPTLAPVPARDLARQRFRFLARLFAAAGYRGWLLLFDEAELIGRYSLLQRARSYAELPWWLGTDDEDPSSPLLAVMAMTDDFGAAVLTGKGDMEQLPSKLRDKQSFQWDETAGLAEAGMRLIDREMVLLEPPDASELHGAYTALKSLHGEAFGWAPPDVPGLERLGATRMRQYVRAWINEWDLVRLDPSFRPATEVLDVNTPYSEQPYLEQPSDDSD